MLAIGVGTAHAGAIAWIVNFFSFPDSDMICSQLAVQMLCIQLVVFYVISMAPFLAFGFSAPYAQSAAPLLLAAVRKGSSERFDWVASGQKGQRNGVAGVQGRMQLIQCASLKSCLCMSPWAPNVLPVETCGPFAAAVYANAGTCSLLLSCGRSSALPSH